MTALGLVLALLGSPAQAEDCDSRGLEASLKEASPVQVPVLFDRLAKCDPARAKRQATSAMSRTLSGEDADQGAVAAMQLGANDAVRDWLAGMEPDHFSGTINRLGARCKDDEAVEAFLVESAEKLGKTFFKDRWHRGLADCRKESIRALLADALANDPTDSRGQYFALVEVYARNFGAMAVPKITEMIRASTDPEVQTYLVEAFSDAANVGSLEGRDADAAAKAAAALSELGPSLTPKAVDTARRTLTALGEQAASDGFVKYRWPERLVDGAYPYGVAAVVTGTCKNGKEKGYLHIGVALEPGQQWPDQLGPSFDKLVAGWPTGEEITKCKGTPSVVLTKMDEPAVDSKALQDWLAKQRFDFESRAGSFLKPEIVEHGEAPL